MNGVRVPNLSVRTSQGDRKCIRGGERSGISSVFLDLLDTRSTHPYYTQFLRDCCSIFQLLQLVRFYMTCAMSMGSNLQSCDYSTPTNVIRQWQGKRRGTTGLASCLHIIRSLFKLQNCLSPPQTRQACCCPALLPLHYPSIHLWALGDNYLSRPRFYVCHIFGKR